MAGEAKAATLPPNDQPITMEQAHALLDELLGAAMVYHAWQAAGGDRGIMSSGRRTANRVWEEHDEKRWQIIERLMHKTVKEAEASDGQ